MTLSREDILGATLEKTTLNVPELGGDVRLQEFTGRTRAKLDMFYMNSKDKLEDAYELDKGHLAVLSIIDDEGNLIFTEKEAGLLADKLSSITLDRIANAVKKLNKLDGEDVVDTAKKSTASRK